MYRYMVLPLYLFLMISVAYQAGETVPLPMKDKDCSTFSVDFFTIPHLLGWMTKAIIFRNRALCWFLSIAFEHIEISFQHVMTNFKECWWDTIILDIAICNAIGIEIGLWILTRLSIPRYSWGRGSIIALAAVNQIMELNTFLLKRVLALHPQHPFNCIRLIVVAIASIISCNEAHKTKKVSKIIIPGTIAIAIDWIVIMFCGSMDNFLPVIKTIITMAPIWAFFATGWLWETITYQDIMSCLTGHVLWKRLWSID